MTNQIKLDDLPDHYLQELDDVRDHLFSIFVREMKKSTNTTIFMNSFVIACANFLGHISANTTKPHETMKFMLKEFDSLTLEVFNQRLEEKKNE